MLIVPESLLASLTERGPGRIRALRMQMRPYWNPWRRAFCSDSKPWASPKRLISAVT